MHPGQAGYVSVSRLAEQSARLDPDRCPTRFGYRTVYGDCVMVKAARDPGVGPVPLAENEREALSMLAFTAYHRTG